MQVFFRFRAPRIPVHLTSAAQEHGRSPIVSVPHSRGKPASLTAITAHPPLVVNRVASTTDMARDDA